MKQRVITAALGIPLVVAVVGYAGTAVVCIGLMGVAAAALWELLAMMLPPQARRLRWAGVGLGCAVMGMVCGVSSPVPYVDGAGMLTAVLFAVFCCGLFFFDPGRPLLDGLCAVVFGVLYVAVLLSYAILIHARPDGPALLFFLLAVTWCGDSGAYVVGRWKGRRPLCPGVSPKKTVEGAAGGFGAGMLAAAACWLLFWRSPGPLQALLLGAGVNVLNQLGDLFESLIKRACGVKDSGVLIPGHGGMLDRIDSLLFALPFLYYAAVLLDA
jgi:phosphatidate cytidylyltransferase